MNLQSELRKAKSAIRACIKANPAIFTDEKLAQIIAFAQDGKLMYADQCGCIRGVMLSKLLHARDACYRCPVDGSNGLHLVTHYAETERLPFAIAAERGYFALVLVGPLTADPEGRGRRRIIPILKAELRLRERARRVIAQGAALPELISWMSQESFETNPGQ